jgi:hypothetical protein
LRLLLAAANFATKNLHHLVRLHLVQHCWPMVDNAQSCWSEVVAVVVEAHHPCLVVVEAEPH